MIRRPLFIVLLIIFPWSEVEANEPDYYSGNYMLPHCQHYTSNDRFDVWDGVCGGIVETLVFMGREFSNNFKICAPKGVSPVQAVRVVVNYMQNHPEELHVPFKLIATRALRSGLKSGSSDGTFDDMERRVAALERGFERIETKLDDLKNGVSEIKGQLKQMPSSLQLITAVVAIFIASGLLKYFSHLAWVCE